MDAIESAARAVDSILDERAEKKKADPLIAANALLVEAAEEDLARKKDAHKSEAAKIAAADADLKRQAAKQLVELLKTFYKLGCMAVGEPRAQANFDDFMFFAGRPVSAALSAVDREAFMSALHSAFNQAFIDSGRNAQERRDYAFQRGLQLGSIDPRAVARQALDALRKSKVVYDRCPNGACGSHKGAASGKDGEAIIVTCRMCGGVYRSSRMPAGDSF